MRRRDFLIGSAAAASLVKVAQAQDAATRAKLDRISLMTNNFDILRFGRYDNRLTWRVGIVQKLPAGLELVGDYERETNSATWPVFAVPSDDTTDFTASRFSVALRWRTSVGK